MREKVLLTGLTASPHFARRGIMFRKCRTLTSGRAQDVLLTLTSIPTQSIEMLPRMAASYSRTNKRVPAFSSQFSVFKLVDRFSVFTSQFSFMDFASK